MKYILYAILSCVPVQLDALLRPGGSRRSNRSGIDQAAGIQEWQEARDKQIRYNNFLVNKKIKNLKEFVSEVEKALDVENNEDVKFIYDPNIDSDNVINILNDNKIVIGKNKFTDDKKQKFIKNLKNRYSETMAIETMAIETLEDFIYCITKLPCSADCLQILERILDKIKENKKLR